MSDVIRLPHEIAPGKDREVQVLLADRWRKLVLIQLRHGALLADHSAWFPITIQTLAGKGMLRFGGQEYALTPGVLVPIDAQVIHNVQGDPDIAILLTFFRQAEIQEANDTTAKFD